MKNKLLQIIRIGVIMRTRTYYMPIGAYWLHRNSKKFRKNTTLIHIHHNNNLNPNPDFRSWRNTHAVNILRSNSMQLSFIIFRHIFLLFAVWLLRWCLASNRYSERETEWMYAKIWKKKNNNLRTVVLRSPFMFYSFSIFLLFSPFSALWTRIPFT